MDQFEEIVKFIQKWFEAILNTTVKSIDDFDDGQLYLELLKKCDNIDIPKDKFQRYEILEETLDKFYKMNTNEIVDYERISYGKTTSYEDVISLCVLLFGICQSHQWSFIRLNDSHQQRFYILIKPIEMFLQHNVALNRNSIQSVISKASVKDLDDYSYEQKSSLTDTTQNYQRNTKQPASDDEMENSLNIVSDASYQRFHTGNTSCYSNNDSNSDMAAHNDSKESLRFTRRNRGLLSIRKGLNQSHINSPYSRKYINSPKIAELRKQEAKRVKNLEVDYKDLTEIMHEQEKTITKLMSEKETFDSAMIKMKADIRNSKDLVDEYGAMIADMDKTAAKKDKDLELVSITVKQLKKEINNKNDEMMQMKMVDKELITKIDSLNTKLQTQMRSCDQIKSTEIEYVKENQDLKNEIERLKRQLEENHEELHHLRSDVKIHNREQYVSPALDNVEGESMNVINEFKLAEMKEEMTKEIDMCESENKVLHNEMERMKINSSELKLELQTLEKKYSGAMSDIKEYSLKLEESNNVIKELRERQVETTTTRLPDVKTLGFKRIVNLLKEMLADVDLTIDERKILLKSIARILNVEHNLEERNHDMCRTEIISLEKIISDLKQSIERKIREYDSLQNQHDDLGHHFKIISDELETEKINNDQLTHYCQVQKEKFDDKMFKLNRALCLVGEEKMDLNTRHCDLKREFLRCEQNLEKTREEFNALREGYDQSLQALKKLSQECQDYEEVIKEITERENKIYRNSSCQTETINDVVSTGTSVMSPRTPKMVDLNRIIRKNNQNSFYNPEGVDQKQSSHALSRKLIADKSLHSLRHIDNSTIDYKYCRSPAAFLNSRTYHRQHVDMSPPTFDKRTPAYRSTNVTRDRQFSPRERISNARDSPLVKPDRLNEICSRNREQPEHLKSSYPIETQGVDMGYLSIMFLDQMNVPLHGSNISRDDHDTPVSTARSSASRRYTNVDPMHFKSDLNTTGATYQYNDGVLLDDLLKRSSSTGVLTARQMNSQRHDSFKKPAVPQLKLESRGADNRYSDRENAGPLSYCSDDDSSLKLSSSSSISFSVLNSPKAKYRGVPCGYKKK